MKLVSLGSFQEGWVWGQHSHPGKKLFATEAFTTAQETPVLGEEGPAPAGGMACWGQSRKDASVPTILLSTRTTTTIATWNVKTMYETGKAAQASAEMPQYNIALLGVSETRWLQARQTRLASGGLLLYSGHEEDNAAHTEGVGIMLSRTAQKALTGWEAHGSRITILHDHEEKRQDERDPMLRTHHYYDDEDKDQFYNRLQAILDKLKDKDINILMGNFNAKVGSDNRGYEEVMGHALGKMNENGERFADLCGLNNLVIGGSIFAHKRIHKATWVSPDHVTENQIDHFCITKKFRRSLKDVRVRRGADAASDHHLLTARL
ncbi:craniofacial development protein 2-like [Montipora capricornis]|uniref:craniofacial development protein 2-like n=1 Tax=Montipora capricornis TaxID=246305 RepID=UPI0035F1E97F